MADFSQKSLTQIALLVGGIVVLGITAEMFRGIVGEEGSSKSGRVTFFNIFEEGYGSLAWVAKEGVKLYTYNIKSAHVESARQLAMEVALTEALTGGLPASVAAAEAQKAGKKAAKLASRQAKRVLGPIVSSGWDFFEAIYYGGTIAEALLRGSGTLVGTYVAGLYGEQRLGKLGYVAGSHLGSWVGGRMGLMVYDVIKGVHHLFNPVGLPEETNEFPGSENEPRYESPGEEVRGYSDDDDVRDETDGYREGGDEPSSGKEEYREETNEFPGSESEPRYETPGEEIRGYSDDDVRDETDGYGEGGDEPGSGKGEEYRQDVYAAAAEYRASDEDRGIGDSGGWGLF